MVGDDRVRRCGTCKQNVYNISEMTRAQAEDVIAAHDARMCLRYYHRADGTILLRDCAVEYRPTGLVVAASVATLALAGGALSVDPATQVARAHDRPRVVEPRHPPETVGQSIAVHPPISEPIYATGGPPPLEHPPEPAPPVRHTRHREGR
jgi:hypothetical protein